MPDIYLFPEIEIQTIEGTIRKGIADEVTRLFYDAVKDYRYKLQYRREYEVNGKIIPYIHTVLEIQPPKANRIVVHEVIYSDVPYKPGNPPKPGKHIVAFIFQAWQVRADRLLIKIQYAPFYADIVQNVVSNSGFEASKKIRPTERRDLDEDEVNRRKEVVRKAEEIRKENPKLLWTKIAEDMDIPERTLRDWRHNPRYR